MPEEDNSSTSRWNEDGKTYLFPQLNSRLLIRIECLRGSSNQGLAFEYDIIEKQIAPNYWSGSPSHAAIHRRVIEVAGRYQLSFCYAVVTQAVQEPGERASVHLTSGVLEMCTKHRYQFWEWGCLAEQLVEVRHNAEDIPIKPGDLQVPDWDEL